MIIKYPTGFYSKSQFVENITFTISSEPPYFGVNNTPKVPEGVVKQNPNTDQGNVISNRHLFGEQIYTITKANSYGTGSTIKKYAYGQTLDAVAVNSLSTVDPMYVSTGVEYLHDQNVLDLESFGLTPSESASLTFSSLAAFQTIRKELNTAIANRKTAEQNLNTAQNNLNDCLKAIEATKVIESTLAGTEQFNNIIDTLNKKKVELSLEIKLQIDLANQAAQEATALRNQLLQVATLVN